MLHTTFKLAKEAGACSESYRKYARHVGGIKKFGQDTPISLTDVIDILGTDDAVWCLRCCTEEDKARRISQLFACACAEHVLHIFEGALPNDNRPRNAIETTRRYIKGEATEQDIAAAWAALDAAWAARAAARDAAGAAAGAAAWAAEREWQLNRFKELLKGK